MSNVNKGKGGRIVSSIISSLLLLGAAGFLAYEHLVDRTFTVTFDCDGGTPSFPSQKVEQFGFARDPGNPTKDGYTFLYWQDVTLGQHWIFNVNHVQQDTNLMAQWRLVEYTITYELDGGTNNPSNPTKYTIEDDEITLLDPTKSGYTFAGWYNGTEAISSIEAGSFGDLTLTAHWN